jgi:hypothetical protein
MKAATEIYLRCEQPLVLTEGKKEQKDIFLGSAGVFYFWLKHAGERG